MESTSHLYSPGKISNSIQSTVRNLTYFRYAELGGYSSLDFKITEGENCDEIVTQPTVFIKLDAVVNMYHHFCDFFNLYASQHINGSFSDDIQIIIWDTVGPYLTIIFFNCVL